jgi:hypothetical protein
MISPYAVAFLLPRIFLRLGAVFGPRSDVEPERDADGILFIIAMGCTSRIPIPHVGFDDKMHLRYRNLITHPGRVIPTIAFLVFSHHASLC